LRRNRLTALAVCCALAAWPLASAAAESGKQSSLANARGCTTCHAFQPANQAAAAPLPGAPAFSDVASRYRGQPGAEDKLVAVVMRGSSPKERHWAGKTTEPAMPANPARISEEDARKLIRWILR
jgi:cytochrome c551/c552